MADASMKFEAQARNDLAPFVDVTDPLGRKYQLVNPAFDVVHSKVNSAICKDAESFATVVKTLLGENRLVELRDSGVFHYADELGELAMNRVSFGLQAADTVKMLCPDPPDSFTQRGLLQYNDQHPGVLTPCDEDPKAVWNEIATFKARAGDEIEADAAGGVIGLSVKTDKTGALQAIPEFWTARSPVYEGHEAFESRLRLEVEVPHMNPQTQKIEGELRFRFSLWSPSASEIKYNAMLDACERMQALLPEFTLIRGQIG